MYSLSKLGVVVGILMLHDYRLMDIRIKGDGRNSPFDLLNVVPRWSCLWGFPLILFQVAAVDPGPKRHEWEDGPGPGGWSRTSNACPWRWWPSTLSAKAWRLPKASPSLLLASPRSRLWRILISCRLLLSSSLARRSMRSRARFSRHWKVISEPSLVSLLLHYIFVVVIDRWEWWRYISTVTEIGDKSINYHIALWMVFWTNHLSFCKIFYL